MVIQTIRLGYRVTNVPAHGRRRLGEATSTSGKNGRSSCGVSFAISFSRVAAVLPPMARRLALPAFAAALFAAAVFLPTGWYATLPKPKERLSPAPVSGAMLVRLAFAAEGLLLLAIARKGRALSVPQSERPDSEPRIGRDVARPGAWLAVITLVAAGLRFWRISSDLWLDEITTVLDYGRVSAFHFLTAYTARTITCSTRSP